MSQIDHDLELEMGLLSPQSPSQPMKAETGVPLARLNDTQEVHIDQNMVGSTTDFFNTLPWENFMYSIDRSKMCAACCGGSNIITVTSHRILRKESARCGVTFLKSDRVRRVSRTIYTKIQENVRNYIIYAIFPWIIFFILLGFDVLEEPYVWYSLAACALFSITFAVMAFVKCFCCVSYTMTFFFDSGGTKEPLTFSARMSMTDMQHVYGIEAAIRASRYEEPMPPVNGQNPQDTFPFEKLLLELPNVRVTTHRVIQTEGSCMCCCNFCSCCDRSFCIDRVEDVTRIEATLVPIHKYYYWISLGLALLAGICASGPSVVQKEKEKDENKAIAYTVAGILLILAIFVWFYRRGKVCVHSNAGGCDPFAFTCSSTNVTKFEAAVRGAQHDRGCDGISNTSVSVVRARQHTGARYTDDDI